MQPLEKEILNLIRRENLVQIGDKVLVGVSGGPDSMALLHVLDQLAPDLDITLAATYVNHGLRPGATPMEKDLVQTAAGRLGIDFFTGDIDVRALAARDKISIEHAARLLRYEFLESTAEKWRAAKIAVAHTADDQAEEILLRLIRGTARKGLSGMKTMRDNRLIRPFLRTPKSGLLAYLEKNSIPFLHDSSNAENRYLRNRIRNDLLPFLADRFNPDIRQTLLRTAGILQDEEELLEEITEGVFADIVTTTVETLAQLKTEWILAPSSRYRELIVNVERFNRQPRAIQRRILEKCFWAMGCESQARRVEQLLQLMLQTNIGASLHLADGLRAELKNDGLCFAYPCGHGPFRGNLADSRSDDFPETSIPSPGIYEFPGLGKRLVVKYRAGDMSGPEAVFPTGEHLDAALFSFPLTVRGPKPGDRFHPLGAPGSKKVSDFLSAQKITRATRHLTPVLCVDETILALPGLRIDHRYRISEKTTESIIISWEDFT